ncbi:hypothetical protein CFSAN002368_05318 [Clostridium botulinum A1 str. CFSAN002368]|nr:hypothetical protein CFSAN002368_05318 [Clostridium botulinum A1 str. CFSAN002368]
MFLREPFCTPNLDIFFSKNLVISSELLNFFSVISVAAFLVFCSFFSQVIVVVFGSTLLSFPTGAA